MKLHIAVQRRLSLAATWTHFNSVHQELLVDERYLRLQRRNPSSVTWFVFEAQM